MIEEILEQVRASVDIFVGKNPTLRNDRDDLVQDVFLKILPRLGGAGFTLKQHRAFAHKATFWVCHSALSALSSQNSKNTISLACAGVQYRNESRDYVSWLTVGEMIHGSFVAGEDVVDWDRVERIAEEIDGLLTWYDIEPEPEIRTMLRRQIEAKFEL